MRRTTVATQRMYIRVGEMIRQVRQEACVNGAELARRIGITQGHLSRIESAETACALHLLVSIADEFDVSLDTLVPVAIDEKELVDA